MFSEGEQIPAQFNLAPFAGTVQETLGDQKCGVENIIRKMNYKETKPDIVRDWEEFWASRVDYVEDVVDVQAFQMPKLQNCQRKSKKQNLDIHIDDGVRKVDVVTFSSFKSNQRNKALHAVDAQNQEQLDELQQGNFVLVQLTPEQSPWYTHPFVIGKINKSVSGIDTTNPEAEFSIQVYLPVDKVSLNKKFVKWQGSDNKYWTPVIKRGMVKGIVDLTSRGKNLSKASSDVIKSTTFKTTFEEESLK